MNSIHRNQAEDHRDDLRDEEAIERIRSMVEKAENCFFCTYATTGEPPISRPMNVRQVDGEGHLWFLSADDSHKNQELTADHTVTLYFQGSKHSDFLQLNGVASVSRDRDKIEDLWEPIIRTWFTGGPEDPRITVIKVAPTDGYYWDTKHGNAIAGMKMYVGALLGKTMDDSIEGTLDV